MMRILKSKQILKNKIQKQMTKIKEREEEMQKIKNKKRKINKQTNKSSPNSEEGGCPLIFLV